MDRRGGLLLKAAFALLALAVLAVLVLWALHRFGLDGLDLGSIFGGRG